MSRPRIDVAENAEQLARSAAGLIVEWSNAAVEARGRFTLALAGGSTPRLLYQLLSGDEFRDRVPWHAIEIFMSDERYVPLDHPDSNFRMAREELLEHVPVPENQIHPVPTDLAPEEAAHAYEATIRQVLDSPAPEIPSLDLILLGIGADGHTASLFPETDALDVHDRLVIENWVPQQEAMRITFTIPLLHQARNVVLLAGGEDKANAVARAIEAPRNLAETPSQCLRDAQGDVVMILEHGAASGLTSTH
jgi:6-phosphogluconolactonase